MLEGLDEPLENKNEISRASLSLCSYFISGRLLETTYQLSKPAIVHKAQIEVGNWVK